MGLEKKRIAFISGMNGYPWGGSEILWSQAASRLLGLGHPVFASVKKWRTVPDPLRALQREGAVIHRRTEENGSPVGNLFDKYQIRIRSAFEKAAAWQRLRAFQPDLVCTSHGTTICGLEWMQRCRAQGLPYVSLSQANLEILFPSDGVAGTWIAAHAAAVRTFFVSRRNLSLFEAQTAHRFENARVVFNPYQVPQDSRVKWPESRDTWNLACVARLEPSAKGQDLILELLAREPWRSRNIRVSFFGTGPNEQSLKRYARMLGVSQQVEFCGHVSNLVEVWKGHHALLLPSRSEGLPLALVEAMLCGRVPIVTAVAGDTSALVDGETGFLAAAPTLELLGQTLERAWERREHWEMMGARARAKIQALIPADPAQVFAEELLRLATARDQTPVAIPVLWSERVGS